MVTRTRARRCVGKLGHPSAKVAMAHLWHLVVDLGAARCRLNVYRCKDCLRWHVGHTPPYSRRRT